MIHAFTHFTAALHFQPSRQGSRFAPTASRGTTLRSWARQDSANFAGRASTPTPPALPHVRNVQPAVTATSTRRQTRQLHASFAPRGNTATSPELTHLDSAQAFVPRDGTAGPVRPSAYLALRGGTTTWLATESSTLRPMSANFAAITRPLAAARVVKSRFSFCVPLIASFKPV